MLAILIPVLVLAGVCTAGIIAFDVASGIVLGVISGVVTAFLLLRRGRKRVESSVAEVEKLVQGQQIDRAIAVFEGLRPLRLWQPGLGASVDGQIGMLRYAHQKDFEGALPYLGRAHPKLWQAWAMLAVAHFKRSRWDEMKDTFERALRRNKNEGMLWTAYAFCEAKRGGRAEAIEVMARACKACPSDERLKHRLLALQNGKKMKSPGHDPTWLALHLERPPADAGNARPRFMPPARRIGARYIRG
jgi:tetratricopeptide (TPR) repeat protein